MCKSVPQTPVRSTLIKTSLIPISGSGTSSSHKPGSARRLTSAFTFAISALARLPRAEENEPLRQLVSYGVGTRREGSSRARRHPPRCSSARKPFKHADEPVLLLLAVLGIP